MTMILPLTTATPERRIALAAIAALVAVSMAGCQTTGSTDPANSYAMAATPQTEAEVPGGKEAKADGGREISKQPPLTKGGAQIVCLAEFCPKRR